MRFASITLALFAFAGFVRADDKKELEKLQGTWKVIKAEKEGEPAPEDKIKDMKVVISDGKISIGDDKRKEEATFTIDSSKKPTEIDIAVSKDKKVQGIYKFEVDTLTIIYTLDGKNERPKDFKSGKTNGILVMMKEKK